jgi:hypothetical protein
VVQSIGEPNCPRNCQMKYSKPWIEVHGEKTDELNTKIDVKRERIKKVCSY